MSPLLQEYINNLAEKFLILCAASEAKKATYLAGKFFCLCYLTTECASCIVRRLYSVNLVAELFPVRHLFPSLHRQFLEACLSGEEANFEHIICTSCGPA